MKDHLTVTFIALNESFTSFNKQYLWQSTQRFSPGKRKPHGLQDFHNLLLRTWSLHVSQDHSSSSSLGSVSPERHLINPSNLTSALSGFRLSPDFIQPQVKAFSELTFKSVVSKQFGLGIPFIAVLLTRRALFPRVKYINTYQRRIRTGKFEVLFEQIVKPLCKMLSFEASLSFPGGDRFILFHVGNLSTSYQVVMVITTAAC